MNNLINPLFAKKSEKIKVEASISPLSKEEMSACFVLTADNVRIPVEVDFSNRVCLPIKKKSL